MLLKYDPLAIPKKNEHDGFVFQSSDKFNIATVAKRNDRARYVRQHQRQLPLMASNQHWRNLPENVQTDWSSFAASFPVQTKANPNVFLTGYQLFCKRQQYLFLNHGLTNPYLLYPVSPTLDTIDFDISLSKGTNFIDVTNLYVYNFGLLPHVGQSVFIRVLPYQTQGARFYPVSEQTLQVLSMPSGRLYVSFDYPAELTGITFSVFLSTPQSKNALFQSSKPRYCGYFDVVQHIPNIIKMGALYNWYAAYNVLLPSSSDWLCPDSTDYQKLAEFIEPGYVYWANTVGGHLKETGFTYWLSPNTGASDSTLFNAKGAGVRYSNGNFDELFVSLYLWNSDSYLSGGKTSFLNFYDAHFGTSSQGSPGFIINTNPFNFGQSIRLVRRYTSLVNGQSGIYIGNDGKVYRTICIGSQEWLADNLWETMLNDGSLIPLINDSAQWGAAITPAMCYFENDIFWA